jgi:ribonuclease HI
MKLFFDGGCSPNPGQMEAAVVSEDGTIQEHTKFGYGTNNEAEWIGFLWAVELAKPFAAEAIEIIGDSKLVVMQSQGLWKCNMPNLMVFRDDFLKNKATLPKLKITHVRRHLNLAGIYIEKLQGK